MDWCLTRYQLQNVFQLGPMYCSLVVLDNVLFILFQYVIYIANMRMLLVYVQAKHVEPKYQLCYCIYYSTKSTNLSYTFGTKNHIKEFKIPM